MRLSGPVPSPIEPKVPMVIFTANQREALGQLRASYPKQVEFFSAHELAYLHFLGWLYRTGRLAL